MIFSLRGTLEELSPTHAVIDVSGVGYYVGVSLQTSQELKVGSIVKLFIQQIIREDANLLYGFGTKKEKEMFNLLISVNGVGAVSALILLSSLNLEDIASAILSKNSAVLQKVKGVGAKTAERIIVDLIDKVSHFGVDAANISVALDNKVKEEALTALEVLGISKKMSEKLADKILKLNPNSSVEELVKQILKSI